MNAGAELIKICQNKPNERHYLIYPILFNYRNAIELAMKWIIAVYVRYSSAEMPKMRSYNLWQLWNVCKQIIIECGSSDDAIYVVEQVIKAFHDLDKSALAFRYSRDQNGAIIALPDGLIDLKNILDVMEALTIFSRVWTGYWMPTRLRWSGNVTRARPLATRPNSRSPRSPSCARAGLMADCSRHRSEPRVKQR